MRTLAPAMRIGMFIVSVLALWIAVALALWWAYDFDAFIRGGAYTRQSAIAWVSEFAAILSVVVGLVWAVSIVRKGSRDLPIWKIAWKVLWRTGFALFVYAAIILARRNFTWFQGSGQDDWAMFFGRVNAEFFSETGPLSFFLEVLPVASLISALLFVAQTMGVRRFVRIPSKAAVLGE